jgi:hypothetical protein
MEKAQIGSKQQGNRTDNGKKISAVVETRTEAGSRIFLIWREGKLSLLFSFFTRTQYRVFILWCEYPQ